MGTRKGVKRQDTALRNKVKAQTGKDVKACELVPTALEMVKEYEHEKEQITAVLESHGIPLPKGWKPVEIVTLLREKLTKELISDAAVNSLKVLATQESAIASNSFTQYVMDLALGDVKEIKLDDVNPEKANIIVFGEGGFQGIED